MTPRLNPINKTRVTFAYCRPTSQNSDFVSLLLLRESRHQTSMAYINFIKWKIHFYLHSRLRNIFNILTYKIFRLNTPFPSQVSHSSIQASAISNQLQEIHLSWENWQLNWDKNLLAQFKSHLRKSNKLTLKSKAFLP